MKVETKNITNVVRVSFMTLATMILIYILNIYKINSYLIFDTGSLQLTIILWSIYFLIVPLVCISVARTEDELLYKYSDVKNVRKAFVIPYLVSCLVFFILAFIFTCCPDEYSSNYIYRINDVLIRDEFSPVMRVLYLSLPAWYTTPVFSVYLDVKNLASYQLPSLFCTIITSVLFTRIMRAILFQKRLLQFKKGKDYGCN